MANQHRNNGTDPIRDSYRVSASGKDEINTNAMDKVFLREELSNAGVKVSEELIDTVVPHLTK